MRVQCDQCGSSYTLPETRVAPGRRLQFQCRHCDHRILVQVPLAAAAVPVPALAPAQPASSQQYGAPGHASAAAAAGSAAAPSSRVLWFVSSPSGQQQRMDSDGVRAAVRDGTVSRDTYLWRKGLAEWQRAGEVPDFVDAFPSAAPAAPLADEPLPTTANNVVEFASIPVVAGAHVAGTASVHRGAGFQTDQRAIPMPIIRPSGPVSEDLERKDERRSAAGTGLRQVQRPGSPSPARQAEAVPRRPTRNEAELKTAAFDVIDQDGDIDPKTSGRASQDRGSGDKAGAESGGVDKGGRWSPATDTYTGQRARMTRRVDEGDRDTAVKWADEHRRLQDEARRLEGDLGEMSRQLKGWQRVAVAALGSLAVVLLLTLVVAYQYRQAQNAADACAAKSTAPEKTAR